MAKISKKKIRKMRDYELRLLNGRLAQELGKDKVDDEQIAYLRGFINLWDHITKVLELEED